MPADATSATTLTALTPAAVNAPCKSSGARGKTAEGFNARTAAILSSAHNAIVFAPRRFAN